MAFSLVRKISLKHRSYVLTLPMAWCQFYGDRVAKVTIIGQNLLIVAPQGLEARALKLIKEDRDD
jgi:hypothetical protein